MSHNSRGRAAALLQLRCPVCLEGNEFRSLLTMHKRCPVCGLHFERETGYFLNAMFIAYALGFLILAPTALALYVAQVPTVPFSLILMGEVLVLWPFVFRYSRVGWMHIDQIIDPRQDPRTTPAE